MSTCLYFFPLSSQSSSTFSAKLSVASLLLLHVTGLQLLLFTVVQLYCLILFFPLYCYAFISALGALFSLKKSLLCLFRCLIKVGYFVLRLAKMASFFFLFKLGNNKIQNKEIS